MILSREESPIVWENPSSRQLRLFTEQTKPPEDSNPLLSENRLIQSATGAIEAEKYTEIDMSTARAIHRRHNNVMVASFVWLVASIFFFSSSNVRNVALNICTRSFGMQMTSDYRACLVQR